MTDGNDERRNDGTGTDTDANAETASGAADTRSLIRPDLARGYVREILERWEDPRTLFIDPAAGRGSFKDPLAEAGRTVRGVDTDPRAEGIRRSGFLECEAIFRGIQTATVVLGSPPFGRNAGTALRYFNHAADHGADAIAFIVPRSFRKRSLQRRLHPRYHLRVNENVPRNAFLRDGVAHDVPCAWQVWTRGDFDRVVEDPPSVGHLIEYVTPEKADFAVRRAGHGAGNVLTENLGDLSTGTTYFLREVRPGVREALAETDWTDVIGQTAGIRSLSKEEIAFRLGEIFG